MKNKLIFFLLIFSTAVFGQSRVLYTTRAALLSGTILNEADVYMIYDTTQSFVETYIKVPGSCTTNDSTINSPKGCYRRRASYTIAQDDAQVTGAIAAMTLSEAKALNDAAFKSIYITDAGKRGMFTYNASGSGTTDDVLKFKNAANLYYEREIKGYELVDNWGAKGDGSTDDYVAIQAAISSGVKRLFFRQGANYRITNEVTLSSNLILEFGGATITQATFNKACFVAYNVRDVILRNGVFYAGYVIAEGGSYSSTRNCGVFVELGKNVTFQQCRFQRWGANGITVTTSQYINVLNCDFIQNYNIFSGDIHADVRIYPGSASNPSVHRIEGNRFLSNNNFAVHISSAENAIISNNIVIPCDSSYTPLATGIARKYGFAFTHTAADSLVKYTVSDNFIANTALGGVFASGNSTSNRLGARVESVNNRIFNVGGGSGSNKGGIVAIDGLRSFRARGNTIERFKGEAGAAIYANMAASTDSTYFYTAEIMDNKITDSEYNGIEVIGHRITVSGNDIANSKRHDIRYYNDKTFTQRGVVIENNKVRRNIANTWTPLSLESTGGNAVRSNSVIIVRNNTIDNAYSSRQAVGMQVVGLWPFVTGNAARNFDIGYYHNENFSGFVWRSPRVSNNNFENCQDGIAYNGASISSSSIVVFGVNNFRGISRDIIRNYTSGANECGIIAFSQLQDGDIWFQASSDPTTGTFQAGDRYYTPSGTQKYYNGSAWTTP